MSVDYYLYSPSNARSVMVGSVGFSGIQSFPAHPEVIEFVRWAIENNVKDIVFVDENHLGRDQDSGEEPMEAVACSS